MIARRVFYSGRVQGVGFRYTTRQIATGYEVTGTVRNLADGRVELIAKGEPEELKEFLDFIRVDSNLSHHILEFEEQEIDPAELEGVRGFTITG